MKKSEYYKNQYPFEHLLPSMEIKEIEAKARYYETDIDFDSMEQLDLKLTTQQRDFIEIETKGLFSEFFKFGYDYAVEIIEKKLKEVEQKSLQNE